MISRDDENMPSIEAQLDSHPHSANGHVDATTKTLKRDPDGFLHRSVQDLFSLDQRTIVITGGGRGIGLAFAFAVAEAGGSVAVLDISDEPHPHFLELVKRFPDQKFKLYK
jgi:sorbose reductase